MAVVKRRLPLGIQTFREIREPNCYYVDKTGYLDRLLDEGMHWFSADYSAQYCGILWIIPQYCA